MQLQTISLPHLQDYPIHAALFKDVQNAPFLRKQLLEGNTAFEYAFIDVTMILSREHVLAACFRAINDMIGHRLKSRNVHSEIVFSFSPNNNIAESFRRFGISDDSKHILAVKVCVEGKPSADAVSKHLSENVQGQSIEFADDQIVKLHDLARLRKIYKFDLPKVSKENAGPGSDVLEAAASSVLGSMALKGS